MLRGEFRRGDGLVIPNNITSFGARQLLIRAIQGDSAFSMWVALVAGVYTPGLLIQELDEPTIGVGGYGRIGLAQSTGSWPTVGQVNDEWYVESTPMIWTPTDTGFDKPITRMAIFGSENATAGDVFCLSGALPAELLIDTDTVEADRTFRYRIYLH